MENHETNLFDLIVKFCQWILDLCRGIVRMLGGMLRLTFQRWPIVLAFTLIACCAGLYYSRSSNRTYAAKMLVQVNGTASEEVLRIMQPLSQLVPECVSEELSFGAMLHADDSVTYGIKRFNARASQLDEQVWQLPQQIGDSVHAMLPVYIDVEVYTKNLKALPRLQSSIIDFLNGNTVLADNYKAFFDLHKEYFRLYSNQLQYIDSLTHHMYMDEPSAIGTHIAGNTLLVGEQRKQTFVDEMKEFSRLLDMEGQIITQCVAPAVVISDFAIPHKPVNGRIRSFVLFGLVGWLLGVIVAAVYNDRKKITEYLKGQ